MKAAVYTRVSTEEQVEGTSLEMQRDRCVAYCEARGWEVVEVYTDEGVSGSLASRPALDRMMAAAAAGRVDIVVVYKLDRFSRSRTHIFQAIETLQERARVRFASVTEAFDTSTPSGDAMLGMLAVFAQMERRTIRDRLRSGVNARVAAGGWGGGNYAPFGYRVVGERRSAHLEVDTREAAVIHEMLRLVLDLGYGPLDTAVTLNALGLTPRKSPTWTAFNVRNILRRGQWSGVWTYGKTSPKGSITAPIEVPVEPIITAQRAAELAAYLEGARRPRKRRGPHPLSGRLFCECGQPMTGLDRSDRQRRRYRCRRRNADPRWEVCPYGSVLADAVDDAVWAQVLALLSDPQLLMDQAREHLQLLSGTEVITAEAIVAAEAAVTRSRAALAGAAARCLAQGLDDATTALTLATLREEHLAAQRHVATLAALNEETAEAKRRMDTAGALAKLATSRLQSADRGLRAQVFALLGIRVRVVSRDGDTVQVSVEGSVAHDLLLSNVSEPLAPSALAITCKDTPLEGF
jgi:DNA invertase Pin-like site-specific DNA recombinase